MINGSENIVRIEEVAAKAGVTTRTIYLWIENRDFPKPTNAPFKPRRWNRDDVEAWLAGKGM